MKFSSLFTGFVAGLATVTSVVASPVAIEKRAAQDVLDGIQNLSDKVVALNATAATYRGGLLGIAKAIKIQIQSGQVQSAIDDAKEAVVDSEEEVFNFEDSQAISVAMVELRPRIVSTLQTLISKEPEFAKGVLGFGIIPLNGIVKAGLVKQKEASGEFADVLLPKLDPAFSGIAPLLINAINAAFDEAIAVFS
ncbi:hypothetical protein VTO42DRAFT_6526 [Malbranchea cinnamomea]